MQQKSKENKAKNKKVLSKFANKEERNKERSLNLVSENVKRRYEAMKRKRT